jgi:hypothetical protein
MIGIFWGVHHYVPPQFYCFSTSKEVCEIKDLYQRIDEMKRLALARPPPPASNGEPKFPPVPDVGG